MKKGIGIAVVAALALSAQIFAANETVTVSNVEQFATALLHMNTNHNATDTIILKRGSYDVSDLDLPYYWTTSNMWDSSSANFGISYFTIRGETDDPRDVVIYRREPDSKSLMYNYVGLVANLTFSNAVINTAGYYPIRCVNTNSKFKNVIVTCCSSPKHGGASRSGTWTDCKFIGNTAARYGGALYDGSKAYGCLFENNKAGEKGGAAYWSTLSNCVVRYNTAESYGGGLGDSCFATDCLIACNVAATYGGGAYSATLSGCVVSNNTAGTHGGGLYSATADGCTIEENGCATQGGGAHRSTLTDCIVKRNGTAGSGGGLGERCFATNCLIACNVATNYGGGTYSATIYGCVVSNNVAGISGGGCYDAKAYRSRICMNIAEGKSASSYSQGGGMRSGVAVDCEIDGNAAFDNEKGTQGGGAFIATLTNCLVRNNYAARLGGGLCTCVAYRCVVSNNVSGSTSAAGNLRTMTSVENCDIYEGAIDAQCALVNCRLMNYTNGNVIAEGANVHTSGWVNGTPTLIKSYCRLTDCLIVSNVVTTLITGSDNNLTALTGCTIADNQYDNVTSGFKTEVGRLVLVNDIIARNRNKNGTQSRNVNCSFDYVAVTNCLFGSYDRSGTFVYPMVNVITNNNPRFVDDGSRDSYALKRSSPAREKGLVQDWMADALDVRNDENYPRLRDGKVDIGCYECWLDPAGTQMIIR